MSYCKCVRGIEAPEECQIHNPPPPPAKAVGTVLDWKCFCGGTMEVSHIHFLVHCSVPSGTGGSYSQPRWLYESRCQSCGAGDGRK